MRGAHTEREAAFEALEDRRLLAGVTLVTHGQVNGSLGVWIDSMAEEIVEVFAPDATLGRITIDRDLNVSSSFDGTNPATTASGEIVVVLDWSDAAGGLFAPTNDTFEVAAAAAQELLRADLIPAFGRALATLPMHIVGFSRGGSVVSEIARELGLAGVWVDHMTTLDPFPRGGDAPLGVPQTVAFSDNYYQQLDAFVRGNPVGSLAYERELLSLPGGYGGIAGDHSDVHLWYHATIDTIGAADDGEADVTVGERPSWFVSGESLGTNAGFAYSRLALDKRLSTESPAGGDMLIDGYHPGDGGGGTRNALDQSNATWPNLVRVANPGDIRTGDSFVIDFVYAEPDSSATVKFMLDRDANPFNGNELSLGCASGYAPTGNAPQGQSYVARTDDAAPGTYRVFAVIEDAGGLRRVLYAPGEVSVTLDTVPDVLDDDAPVVFSSGLALGKPPALDETRFDFFRGGLLMGGDDEPDRGPSLWFAPPAPPPSLTV